MIAIILSILMEEAQSQQQPDVEVENTNTNQSQDDVPLDIPVESEEQKSAPKEDSIACYGSALLEFKTRPVKQGQNSNSNASLEFMYGGPAKNVAEVFGRLGGKSKLYTMVGEDTLGSTMKAELGSKHKIDTQYIETDKKIATATKITVQVTDKQLRSALSMSTQEDLEDSKESPVKEIVQINDDVLQKVAYRYLYPNFKNVNDSKFIFADAIVNENSIKALIQNFGSKLFLYLGHSDNAVKLVNIFKSYFSADKKPEVLYKHIYLTLDEALLMPKLVCESVKQLKSICKEKPADFDQLLLQADEKKSLQAVTFLKNLLLVENIFVKTSANQLLVSLNEKSFLAEHNCQKKCVIAENGADEAFVAGFLKAQMEGKSTDDSVEYGMFSMISALKTEMNVNQEMSGKRVCVRVFYTLVVAVVFGGAAFVAWSVWATGRLLQSSNIDFTVATPKAVVETQVFVSSNILGVPIHPAYATADGSCACMIDDVFVNDGTNNNVDCYPLKQGKFSIFNSVYQFNQDPTFDMVSRQLVESPLMTNVNLAVLIAGVAVIVLGVVFIFMVLCCCESCCTCSYCGKGLKNKLSECMRKNQPVQYVNNVQQIPNMQQMPGQMMFKAMV
uniref:PfkB family carbohydrate kinase protein n=1 Tax=Trepomonas sp. PC1 TaxID=1076344 RepID=A0A146KFA1_9EUKA|eukprot:JAP93979.1 pfkB family carbohydrate kinase protein [Trepomonas sp. PC1]